MPPAARVVAECRKAGTKAIAVQADVATEPDVVRLFEAVDRGRDATALVNNAGILEKQMRVISWGAPPTPRNRTIHAVLDLGFSMGWFYGSG